MIDPSILHNIPSAKIHPAVRVTPPKGFVQRVVLTFEIPRRDREAHAGFSSQGGDKIC